MRDDYLLPAVMETILMHTYLAADETLKLHAILVLYHLTGSCSH